MSHFYSTEGKPFYQIPTLDGKKLRDCNIRDARKLKLVPGVTDVLKVAAKPALEEWIINQILEAVLRSDWIPNDQMSEYDSKVKQWKGIVRQEAARIGKEAAEKGNVIHDNLENAFLGLSGGVNVSLDAITKPVIEFITDKFGEGFVAEASFASPLGFGGKIDLHHPEKKIIIDFKTKPDKAFEKDLGYDDHVTQLAAYAQGLGFTKQLLRLDDNLQYSIKDGEYYNLFISHETPGKFELVEWSLEEMNRGLDMFLCLLKYWQLSKKFDSSFIRDKYETVRE